MNIYYLEVDNFKSFRGKHRIGPFSSMTGIIGPNGCGKSNIVDALTFVFHIENARNNHPISTVSANFRPEGCSVEVVLLDKHSNKISFQKTQSRKKQLQFFIDSVPITQEDYLIKLTALKIGPHSFMLQGETDKLIKKKPEELSDIMERACGSVIYKKEYEELTEKLKVINDETMQIISEQKNLRKEDQKLRSINEQNEKYEILNLEIKTIEAKIEQANFFQIDRSLLQEMKHLATSQTKLDERKTEEAVQKQRIQANNIRIKELSKEKSLKEQEKERLKEEIRRLSDKLAIEEERVGEYQSFQENTILEKSLESQIREASEQLERIKQQLIKEEDILNDLNSEESQKSNVQSEQIRTNYAEYQEIVRKCSAKTISLEQELKKLNNDLSNANSELKGVSEAQHKQNSHIDDLNSKISDAQNIELTKQAELTQRELQLKQIRQELEEVESIRRQNTQKVEILQIDLNKLIANKYNLEYELDQMEDVRAQDKVYRELYKVKGFYGTLSDLIRNTSNKAYDLPIKIALGSMLNCLVVDSPQTASIVNVTLGSQGFARDVMILQNLPHASDDMLCKALIGNLGELAAGLVDIDERCGKYEDNPDLRRRIGETLKYLLRGKVICDTVEKAFSLRAKRIVHIHQIITKDGDIVSNGSIQISSSDKERLSKKDLGTAQNIANLEKKIAQEEKLIDKKILELDSLKNSDLEKQYNKLIESFHTNEQSIELLKAEIAGQTEKIRKLQEKQEQMRRVVEKSLAMINLERIVREIEKKIGNVQKNIEQKQDEEYGPFCKKVGIQMSEMVNANAETVERVFKRIEKQQNRVQELKEQLTQADEKRQALERAIQKYRDNQEKYGMMSKQFIELQKQSREEQKEMDAKYKRLLLEENTLEKERSLLVDENERGYEQLIAQPNQIRKEILQIKHAIGQFVDKKDSLWQECKLKQIDFEEVTEVLLGRQKQNLNMQNGSEPQNEQNHEMINEEDEYQSGNTLSVQFSNEMKEYTQFLSQIDDRKLQESISKFIELEMLNYSLLFADRAKFQRRMRASPNQNEQTKLESLIEGVDVNSLLGYQDKLVDELDELRHRIEEYASKELAEGLIGNGVSTEEMRTKKDNLKSKLIELGVEKKKFEEELKAVKLLRKEKFDEFFREVQSQVRIQYSELTKLKGKHAAHRGTADLTVTNEEEKYKGGINYFCCPPKKSYALNPEKELSGGEKTLAQMALFLAIAKDSPFLVLDESEAALDQSNTLNVIDTLKSNESIFQQQKLMVSHNLQVYSACNSLIGTTFNRINDTSFTLSLNLNI